MAVSKTMLSLLLISMTNMAMAANPQCLAALDKLCVDAKGSAACMTCVKGNAAALKAVGCRIIDEDKFCGDSPKPGPKPVSDKCTAALSKSCAAEQQKGEAVCDQCVEKVDKASKLNCSHVEELKFCDKAPKPAPVDQKCEMELIAACAPVGGNKGTTAECDACVKKNLGSLKGCTSREELSWCAMAPEPRPVADVCEKELKAKCGPDIKTDPAKCESCVKRIGATENCTRREEATFCGGEPPAPSPAPIADKCELLLVGECTASKAQGERECDSCVKKVGPSMPSYNCSLREELKFCGTKAATCSKEEATLCTAAKAQGLAACAACLQTNSAKLMAVGCHASDETKFCDAPTPPTPITDECISFLNTYCHKDIGEKTCDMCVKDFIGSHPVEGKKCTKREEIKFCGDVPTPAHNITDNCVRTLHAQCDASKKKSVRECDECVAKIGPEVKTCTLREELTFCNVGPSPPTPGPRPMDPGCEKELAMLCQFDRTNQTACLACVKENEKVLIEREHCNRTEVMKFC